MCTSLSSSSISDLNCRCQAQSSASLPRSNVAFYPIAIPQCSSKIWLSCKCSPTNWLSGHQTAIDLFQNSDNCDISVVHYLGRQTRDEITIKHWKQSELSLFSHQNDIYIFVTPRLDMLTPIARYAAPHVNFNNLHVILKPWTVYKSYCKVIKIWLLSRRI